MIEGVLFSEGDDRILVFRLFHAHEHKAWLAAQSDSTGAATGAQPTNAGRPTGLSGLLLPSQTLTGVLDEPLERGRAYEAVLTSVFNLAGLEARGAKVVVAWETPAPDSATVPSLDTTIVPPDTLGIRVPPARR